MRCGFQVTLIDASRHPRFAIGESSTPIADQLLRLIGQRYRLDDLVAMSSYGRWRDAMPADACGKKRGFSYFDHRSPKRATRETHRGEKSLLVAASPTDEASDTHWYRHDVDAMLFQRAQEEGAETIENARVIELKRLADNRWRLLLSNDCVVDADGVLDASGGGVMAKLLGGIELTGRLKTHTAAAFSHYRGVRSVSNQFDQTHRDNRGRDPFDADDAAQHHLIDNGWVWMLRFENGITSVGVTQRIHRSAEDAGLGCQRILESRFEEYPELAEVMREASFASLPGCIRRVDRIQRFYDPLVAENCVMLPTAAFTLDPLHSTGIAHALSGVIRLATWLENGGQQKGLERYRDAVIAETRHLDRLVSMAYRSMHSFEAFTAACMVYFAAAIECEESLMASEVPDRFWMAGNTRFCEVVRSSEEELGACERGEVSARECTQRIRDWIAPWNHAGLFDSAENRYAYTATKVS